MIFLLHQSTFNHIPKTPFRDQPLNLVEAVFGSLWRNEQRLLRSLNYCLIFICLYSCDSRSIFATLNCANINVVWAALTPPLRCWVIWVIADNSYLFCKPPDTSSVFRLCWFFFFLFLSRTESLSVWIPFGRCRPGKGITHHTKVASWEKDGLCWPQFKLWEQPPQIELFLTDLS